ncbi:hypothetical protein RhiJN_23401 [Ceratobasidium sp. AG-Ba]|nr:hypothetical protein RhiJN_23401 [Ceratobasidium sp. AG-Ba]
MAQSLGSPYRLRDIFPPGFDSRVSSQSSWSGEPYTFTPGQLYDKLTYQYTPGGCIQSVLVNSVWYGKQKTGVRHEFILVEVEDIKTGFVNYIVLDRNKKPAAGPAKGNNATPGTGGCSQSSCGPASDAFRVSYDGKEPELVGQCLLLPRRYVEKLEFDHIAEPLYLYQLVTLVHILSRASNTYNLGRENCYWFSGVLWECLRELRPLATHISRGPKRRGKFGLLRYTPDDEEKQKYCNAFKDDIVQVEERLKQSRQEYAWRS